MYHKPEKGENTHARFSHKGITRAHIIKTKTTEDSMTHERRGWYVRQSFSNEFVDCLAALMKKYPDKMFEIQGIADKHTDLVQFSKSFFGKSASNVADVSVDDNANVSEKNIVQWNYEISKPILKLNSLYLIFKWVKKYFGKKKAQIAIEKVVSGELFVNDLSNVGTSYCFAFDLRNLLFQGMNFFQGSFQINPPKHSESFIALLIQSTAYISNQITGACSYPDAFVALDWFYRKELGNDYAEKKDKETWKKIKNQFQNLIFSLCFPFRGNQAAFTNLSVLDMGFLKQLFEDYTYPDGSKPHLKSVLELSKAFFDYYTEINGKEGMFTFPVMTLAISLDENGEYLDPDFVDWAAEANCKKSLANIFQSEPTQFSSCCRLRNDISAASGGLGYQNSFGVGGLSVGSHRVAGLNLARIALLEKDNPDILEEDLDILHAILRAHRHLIKHRAETGSLPLYESGWMDLSRQYSTVGFVGAYEYVVNKGLDIKTEEGVKALTDTLLKVEEAIKKWQERDNKERVMIQIKGRYLELSPYKDITVLDLRDKKVKEIKAKDLVGNEEHYEIGFDTVDE